MKAAKIQWQPDCIENPSENERVREATQVPSCVILGLSDRRCIYMLSQERQPGLRQQAKVCREKQRLIHTYNTEAAALARSVEALAALDGDPRDAYGDLWRLAGEGHLRSQQARLAVERHAAEHGC
jgi:hypothetical protein